MKHKIITLSILALAAISGVRAQERTKPTQDPAVQQQRNEARATAEQSEVLAKELGLTPEQSNRVKEIDAHHTRAMDNVRSTTTEQATLQKEVADLEARREAQLKEVLTPEQYAKMTSMQKK